MRTRRPTSVGRLTLAALWLAGLSLADIAVAQQVSPLTRSLAIDEWNESRFAEFQDGTPLTVDERREIERLVARLDSLDRRVYYTSPFTQVTSAELLGEPNGYRGRPVYWRGDAVQVVVPPPAATQPDDVPPATICVAGDEDGGCQIATASVPERWSQIALEAEPIGVRGIFVKVVENGVGEGVPLIAASHLEWHPTRWSPPAVNYGMSVLGIMDIDVMLLQDVVQRTPLLRSETVAFYKLLAGMRATTAQELAGWAERHLPRHRQTWSDVLRDPTSNHRRLALEVLRQAEEGRYAVAPFFNTPEQQVGDLVVVDGLVRRALRIDTTGDVDALAAGVDHYYELAVFTDDSQNNPLMFCVLEVPATLPLGDDVRVPVRVAGFFFKNWRYSSRRADETGGEQLRLAPMFIGYGPLELVEQEENPAWAILAGLTFVLVLAGIWLAGVYRGRRDRAFAQTTLERLQRSDESLVLDDTDLPGTGI